MGLSASDTTPIAKSWLKSFLPVNSSSLRPTESVLGFGELAAKWSAKTVKRFVSSRRTTAEVSACLTRERRPYTFNAAALGAPHSRRPDLHRGESRQSTVPHPDELDEGDG